MYVSRVRRSFDIGIFGKKGCGKTLLLSFYGYLKYIFNGDIVLSNFKLNYPHVFIDSIEDLSKIYDLSANVTKIFLADDFERWFGSAVTRSKINVSLNDLLLDFGKINCSTVYTAKRSMAINIGLRESTNEFWFPELRPVFRSSDNVVNRKIVNYLNFLKIFVVRYDENLEEIPSFSVYNLDKICSLYDTQEIVKEILPPLEGVGNL